MVKISKETIIRANEMSKRRPKHQYINDQPSNGELFVSVRYSGVTYSQKIKVWYTIK